MIRYEDGSIGSKDLDVLRSDNDIILAFRIPIEKKRDNPYMPGEDVGTHPTLTGMYDEKWARWGFAWTIDMDYKDKADQYTDIILDMTSFIEREAFEKLCTDFGFPFVVHPATVVY